MPRRNDCQWRRVVAGESPPALRGGPTHTTVLTAAVGPISRAGPRTGPCVRTSQRRMGDPDRRLQKSGPSPCGSGGRPRPGAASAPVRRLVAAADSAVRQYGSLSRPPWQLVRQLGLGRLHASQPTPIALRRRATEPLMTAPRQMGEGVIPGPVCALPGTPWLGLWPRRGRRRSSTPE